MAALFLLELHLFLASRLLDSWGRLGKLQLAGSGWVLSDCQGLRLGLGTLLRAGRLGRRACSCFGCSCLTFATALLLECTLGCRVKRVHLEGQLQSLPVSARQALPAGGGSRAKEASGSQPKSWLKVTRRLKLQLAGCGWSVAVSELVAGGKTTSADSAGSGIAA